VLAGVLTMMLLLGALIAALSVSIGRALSVIIPISDLMIILLGVMLLANLNPFKKLPQIQVPVLSNSYMNAFLYGMLYGPIALPCSGPLVVGIFAYSLTAGEYFSKLGVFIWFGIGFGLPLFLLSFLSGASQRWITRFFAQNARIINVAAGIMLIAVAVYDLAVNWENILLFI
jgi:cytochrome c-type biogenesis protein